MTHNSNKLFLLDAYALIFRAYYAFVSRPMRNAQGLNTSAIFGFTKFLRDIIVRERPRYLGVAFDPKGGNFRHKLYPLYKANRAETPEDIRASVPYIKRILDAMCVPVLEVPGWEADDVIGTLSVEAAAAGFDTYMVTPDKDYGQLVSDHAFIYKQSKGGDGVEIVDREAIRLKYGVDDPRLVADILALWGDASDNVPGVAGIGEKGAVKLVGQFGTVENLLAALGVSTSCVETIGVSDRLSQKVDSPPPPQAAGCTSFATPPASGVKISDKLRANIVAGAEQLVLSKRLVTIDTAAPIDFEPSELEMCDPDCDALREIYNELGFNMFLREMETDPRSPFRSSVLCRGEGQGSGARKLHDVQSVQNKPGPPTAGGGLSKTLVPSSQLSTSREATELARVVRGEDESVRSQLSTEPQPDLFSGVTAQESYEVVNVLTDSELNELAERLLAAGEFAFALETAGRDYFAGRIVAVNLCVEPDKVYRVEGEAIVELKAVFEDPAIAKISHDIKTSMHFLRSVGMGTGVGAGAGVWADGFDGAMQAGGGTDVATQTRNGTGIELRGRLFDTMIEGYLLDPEGYKHRPASAAAMLELHRQLWPGLAAGSSPSKGQESAAKPRSAAVGGDGPTDFQESPNPTLKGIYEEIEEPLIAVLESMEWEGVRIDSRILNDYAGELSHRLAGLEAEIRRLTDEPGLNVNSSQQLGEALFGKMRLAEVAAEKGGKGSGKGSKVAAKPKMTKTKRYSTDEETLTAIAHVHPVVEMVLEYRGVKKLLSTYVEALPRLVNPRTGRVHTTYNQAVTATGRLSSTNPNLQNIPIREEQGRPIRRAFVPSDGDHVLLSADYSQVELRLMAHLSGDGAFIGAFRAGEDIHRATAAKIFGVPLDEVTSEMRRRAKTANFGIIYGISAFGLAQRLAIPRHEAGAIIDGYFRSYPGVKEYMDRVGRQAASNGYVETIFGRRRWLPDINSANPVVRALAQRNAINAPIQGSAADIMKIAMVRIFDGLRARGLRSKMIMQVHDEVVVDVLREELDEVRGLVVEAMESAAQLSVRLVVDSGAGENWLDAH